MEVIGSGKHSSLLRHGNNYCRKKFYSTGPWPHFQEYWTTKNDSCPVINWATMLQNFFICIISIRGFVKITRSSIMTIPSRLKIVRTISWQYLHYTGIVLAWIHYALSLPGNNNWYHVCQVLLGIGKYCLVLGSIVKSIDLVKETCSIIHCILQQVALTKSSLLLKIHRNITTIYKYN